MDGLQITAVALGFVNGILYAGWKSQIGREGRLSLWWWYLLVHIGPILIPIALLIMAIYGCVSKNLLYGISIVLFGWLLAGQLSYFIMKFFLLRNRR